MKVAPRDQPPPLSHHLHIAAILLIIAFVLCAIGCTYSVCSISEILNYSEPRVLVRPRVTT